MWGNQNDDDGKDDDNDENGHLSKCPLQKSDNCEYEGGGELSWGSQGEIGGRGKYDNY